MMYKAKVALCSENIQTELNHYVEFVNVKYDRSYVKFLAGFKSSAQCNKSYVQHFQVHSCYQSMQQP